MMIIAKRKIKQNLRLLKLNESNIDKTLNKYKRILSEDAKEIYDKLMNDQTFN
jgi:hypothetical protein